MKYATSRITFRLVALFLIGVPLVFASPTPQAMESVSLQDGQQGRLVFSTDSDGEYQLAPTLKTDVAMTITGMIARVKVTQHFTNPSQQWVNGVYTFPLPEMSAVDHLTMHIGERTIQGLIQEKQKAKRMFQKAKIQGKKASLVEQHRPNIFSNNVANIGPDETVIVEIEYQQTLEYDQGEFSIRFPMVVAPRFSPSNKVITEFEGSGWAVNAEQVPSSAAITPGIKTPGIDDNHNVTMSITLETGFDLASLTSDAHPLVINEITPQQFDIELDAQQTIANRDFVLRWRPVPSETPQGAFFTQQKGNDNYALLMVIPPYDDVDLSRLLTKEMVFVIDTSGSMHGESMEQARRALLSGLDRLNPGDRFNIVEFNSVATKIFHTSMPVTNDNINRAKRFVRELQAQGGTNIADALNMSLPRTLDESMIRQVIFITDGSVGNEEELFDIIHDNLGDSRLFTIGIGSAPNSRFMRGAATFGRGTFTYIGAVDQVTEKMSQLFEKLESPVLSDVKIVDSSGNVLGEQADYWPNPIGDLYLGEPIIVSLKLPLDQQNLSISGKLATQDWYMDLPISTGGSEKGLDVLWARNKIASLSESARTPMQRKNNATAITELGLKHHLVTRYTSLIAVDVTPTKPESEQVKDTKLANHLPDGWTKHKPHGQLPRGATSAPLNVIMGLVLLMLTLLLSRRRKLDLGK
ncbi:MAG: marine proteobacterial sortase target protein [Algicola sp.]|nr:marine proteobacterial sortase target protein [Algicola sp.]